MSSLPSKIFQEPGFLNRRTQRFDSIDNSAMMFQKLRQRKPLPHEQENPNKIDLHKFVSRRRRSTVVEFES
jgi:hypothetical protein